MKSPENDFRFDNERCRALAKMLKTGTLRLKNVRADTNYYFISKDDAIFDIAVKKN
jgi:hypothetical protein